MEETTTKSKKQKPRNKFKREILQSSLSDICFIKVKIISQKKTQQ